MLTQSQGDNHHNGKQNQQKLLDFDAAQNSTQRLSTEALQTDLYLSSSKFPTEPNETENTIATTTDLVCFSHLRWDFVYQRPQHLLSRFSQQQRVFFIEEPIIKAEIEEHLEIRNPLKNVWVVVPHLLAGKNEIEQNLAQKRFVDRLLTEYSVEHYIFWYYTPMAIAFTSHLKPLAVIYDCMDELSAFKGASPTLKAREAELLRRADVVFTGGESLYEAKRDQHNNIYAFPSSVDVPHFSQARSMTEEPIDQANIPHPRLGFSGVIDERMDIKLLAELADRRSDWHFVIIGPVAKIDPTTLPQRTNIHYLGSKDYQELPHYLAGWDVALLPFAHNESTQFISPTKTPEYLAAGKPVVSTSIRDVVRPYGRQELVRIADGTVDFIAASEAAMREDTPRSNWMNRVDTFLEQISWDRTQMSMLKLIDEAIVAKQSSSTGFPQFSTASREFAFDYLVVGAGFSGSVIAEQLASSGKKILVVDRRTHIAGNAYDHYDSAGILVHKYGPHIFHTNSREVFQYLSRFTEWRSYEHRVLASVEGQLLPIPINLDTINKLYGLSLNSFQVEEFLASLAEPKDHIYTSEDIVVSKIGRELYEKFFRNYTRKQWGLDPSELDRSVLARIPTRTNRDDRYFTDSYQAMPLHGFTKMFENILNHPNIKVMLNTDYREIQQTIPCREMVYSGPVDDFFNYQYGRLPYRSLEFKHETHNKPIFQSAPVINYPNEHLYTRITEFKYLTGQEHLKSSIVYEFPKPDGDPYYPVPRPENAEIYKHYKDLADAAIGVYFVGRLATYKYYNMDQCVAQALTTYKQIVSNQLEKA